MQKQYDPSGLEEKWSRRWEEEGLFRPEGSGEGRPFVITLPPPNVTGVLHIGHCLGTSVMDCLVRYYRMRGRPTLFLPGTDHASIATETKVVQQLEEEGHSREELGREGFLQRAWDWSNRHHDRIVQQFRRLGASLDWMREAFTMDEQRSRAVAHAFVHLYEKGWIYRGDYMVNWSVAQRSAVSDEEVEHSEVEGKLWYIRYPVDGGDSLVVATTRPETMLGDTAVAIHPANSKTRHLRGKKAQLPLVGRELPIIEDDHVDPEFGSGCVKVTPAHDPNDYEMGKRHGLPFVNILEPDGRLNGEVPEAYRGLDRFEARERVVADLQRLGLIERVESHRHMVGFHDRTGTVVEPLISTQWFLKMDELAAPALAAVEEGSIRMFPSRWVGVYFNWMRNIKDWCISRQLWWGHRIPVWTCAGCSEVIVQVDAPQACPACGSEALEQDPDVLDTWFSSWLWTFSPLGWPERSQDLQRYHPTSVLVTGHDIIFFWVARMIMASYEFLGEPPFREVLFTGIVRDSQGRRMSKSLGNSPDPMDIMGEYGADALRFTLLMLTPTGQDVNFAPDSIEMGRNFCNKVWNATRLLLGSLSPELGLEFPQASPASMRGELAAGLEGKDAEQVWTLMYLRTVGAAPPDAQRDALQLEDRWILHRLLECAVRIEEAVEARRLNDAAHEAYATFWHEYCDWYLEAIKPRLHGSPLPAKRTALLTALMVHAGLLRLLHPFVPFLTEELWHLHPATGGWCIVAPMPRHGGGVPFGAEAARFELVKQLVQAARSLRQQVGAPPGKRGHLLLRAPVARQPALEELAGHVEVLAKMESVEVVPPGPPPPQAAAAVVEDVQVYLPMAGLIDLDRERERLRKERDGLCRRLAGVRGKLANAAFVAKAPAHVVAREKELALSLEQTLAKLDEQIAALE